MRHVVRGTAPTVGAAVHGVVDWTRRFDHMQQHTGQHLLSAVIEHAFKARTVSFHLGASSSTIDIDRELSAADIARAEAESNRVIWQDLPVSIRYATEEKARALPLRKESARTGTLRLIDIESTDLSAFGGTHVARTGMIGQLLIASWERFKGGQRIEFLCGGRALARAQQLRDVMSASIRLLSVIPTELPSAIERMQQEAKDRKLALAAAQIELATHEGAALAASAEPLGAIAAVLRVAEGDANRLKALASAIAQRSGVLATLVSASRPSLAVAARASDVSLSCQDLIAAIAGEFGGRGGGRPDMAQCGNLQADPTRVLDFARSWIERGGPPRSPLTPDA